MSRKRTVEDWRQVVFRSRQIKDSTRVVLLFLSDYAKTRDMTVSVPRSTIAERLGKSERVISARIADAHAHDLLDTVSHGHRGRTAVYAITFPDRERVSSSNTLMGAETQHPLSRERVNHGVPTITTADLSASPHDLNGSTYEEWERTHALPRLAGGAR